MPSYRSLGHPRVTRDAKLNASLWAKTCRNANCKRNVVKKAEQENNQERCKMKMYENRKLHENMLERL